jgi:3-oxoacyl-[acyl-carrier-protein] synthase II
MASGRDVVVTGLGVISPIGSSVAELWDHLRANRSGIRLWQWPNYAKQLPAGLVEREFANEFSKLDLPYLDRCSQMAILAARQAMRDAGIEQFADYGYRAGLYYGSVGGSVKTEHDWV